MSRARDIREIDESKLEHVRGGVVQSTAVSQDHETEVLNNPLYEASGNSGANPLYAEVYEML